VEGGVVVDGETTLTKVVVGCRDIHDNETPGISILGYTLKPICHALKGRCVVVVTAVAGSTLQRRDG